MLSTGGDLWTSPELTGQCDDTGVFAIGLSGEFMALYFRNTERFRNIQAIQCDIRRNLTITPLDILSPAISGVFGGAMQFQQEAPKIMQDVLPTRGLLRTPAVSLNTPAYPRTFQIRDYS